MPHSPFIHGKYSCTQCIVDTENGIYNFSHVLSSTTNNGTACEGIPGSARKGQKATQKYLWDQLRWFGDFPGGANCKEPACQCRRLKRCGFDPWVGKTPWRRKWQPTPVFLPGNSHGQRSLMRPQKSQTWLSDWTKTTHVSHISVKLEKINMK